MPRRMAIGRTTTVLSVIIVLLGGTMSVILIAPQSIVHPIAATSTQTATVTEFLFQTTLSSAQTVTTTSTQTLSSTQTVTTKSTETTTMTKTSTKTTTRTLLGAENQCGFTTTCEVLNPSGLELILSINSTKLRPNDAITLNVTIFNTLSVMNNISSANYWMINGGLRWWPCPDYISPDGIAILRGYYTISNLTSASPVSWWAEISCHVALIYDETGIIGVLPNVTSYAFQPKSASANYSADYFPCSDTLCNSATRSVVHGTFPPTGMVTGTTIYATNSTTQPYHINSLHSTVPSIYTLVAGDEWGDLVLLHFTVVSP